MGNVHERKKSPPPGGFFDVFHIKSSYSHEPRVGTDIIGPGEAGFAIRWKTFKGCKSKYEILKLREKITY